MPARRVDQWAYFGRMMLTGPANECWPWPYLLDRKGYAVIGANLRVARIACESMHGTPFDGAQACHQPLVCTTYSCFNPHHLRWGDCHDQAADRLLDESYLRGEAHPLAVLTADDVRTIRERRSRGALPSQLGREFGVSATQITRITSRKSWAHVD